MSTQNNQPKKLDFLELTDAEKADFIREAKKNLRDQLEEAKLWRTLAESDPTIINGLDQRF
jgi:hypothetical protein